MTETPAGTDAGTDPAGGPAAGTTTAAPPPPLPPADRLVRPRTDRVFRGVCSALGRATGTDPVLWRVLVVVLALFGGSGIVLYLAGWLLIPEEGAPTSAGQDLMAGSTAAKVGVTALGVVAVLVVLDEGRGLVPLAVVGAIAWLVWRNRTPVEAAPTTGAAAWGAPPAWAGEPTAWTPPPPPAPVRPRSNLGALTVSGVVAVVGGLLLARSLGADAIEAEHVFAAALAVTGVGLLVGTRWGRSRGLIALALVLAAATGLASATDDRFGGETGDRRWAVTGPAEHRLAAGTATLDLTPLSGMSRDVAVDGRVGVGELVVLVPEDARVLVDAEVGFGALRIVDVDGFERELEGGGLDREQELGPDGRRNITLDVRVGVGELEVRVVPAD